MKTYSIKVALRGVSPMIGRKLRVRGNTSLADLHHIIQIAMGWDDEYLHYFHIYGQDYGVYRPGGMLFSQDAEQVFIDDFTFDAGDRFSYVYNFRDWWLCDIRVEEVDPPGKPAPRCFGGSGRQGDSRYYKLDEHIALYDIIYKVGRADETMTVGKISEMLDHYESIRFSRRSVNKQLKENFPNQAILAQTAEYTLLRIIDGLGQKSPTGLTECQCTD